MRPSSIPRIIKSRSVNSVRLASWPAAALAIMNLLSVPVAIACMGVSPDKSAEVKLSIGGGVEAAVQMSLFEANSTIDANAKGSCSAYAYLPLSAFPSTSNRYGVGEIAAAIREQVDAWDLSECLIVLDFANDTNVDIAQHELCTLGTFAFEKGSFWSSGSESYCWEPSEI